MCPRSILARLNTRGPLRADGPSRTDGLRGSRLAKWTADAGSAADTMRPTADAPETVRWISTKLNCWEARIAGDVIGTIVSSFTYSRVYAVALTTGGRGGSHSSLENAKAQLEGWARWQVRHPWSA